MSVNNATPSSGSLHKVGVLLLEQRKVTLSIPVPDTIRGEDKIHLFKRALIRLWIEGPDDDDCEDINAAE